MTIQPRRDSFIVLCDSCPDCFRVETVDFRELIKTIKIKGWKIYQDDKGDWLHKCKTCQEK